MIGSIVTIMTPQQCSIETSLLVVTLQSGLGAVGMYFILARL